MWQMPTAHIPCAHAGRQCVALGCAIVFALPSTVSPRLRRPNFSLAVGLTLRSASYFVPRGAGDHWDAVFALPANITTVYFVNRVDSGLGTRITGGGYVTLIDAYGNPLAQQVRLGGLKNGPRVERAGAAG
jgi:hypothetical protein